MKTISLMAKQFIAVLISCLLAVSFCPAFVYADESNSPEQTELGKEVSNPVDTTEDSGKTLTESGTNVAGSVNQDETVSVVTETTPEDESATKNEIKEPEIKEIVGLACKSYVYGKSKWLSTSMGKSAGVSGGTSGMTALKISKTGNVSGGISYQTFQKGKGWTNYVSNGKQSGNKKLKNAIQGMRIKLTGNLGKKYDVYYRVNVIAYGWTGWGKNGQAVGAKNLANIRAYQVKLVKKGEKAPGSSANRYLAKGTSSAEVFYKKNMASRTKSMSSKTKYLIAVNTSANRVEIFQGKKNNWKPVKYFKCTSGAKGSPTVKGAFTVKSKGLAFGSGYTCWYWTQFYGNYLFHTVLYQPGSKTKIQDGRLGINASHGCVRLSMSDAKWIYNNIPKGTKVFVY